MGRRLSEAVLHEAEVMDLFTASHTFSASPCAFVTKFKGASNYKSMEEKQGVSHGHTITQTQTKYFSVAGLPLY